MIKKSTFWAFTQFALLLMLIFAAWPLPLWRYVLVLAVAYALASTERRWARTVTPPADPGMTIPGPGLALKRCPECGAVMNPAATWWWTTYGATDSENCARSLVEREEWRER